MYIETADLAKTRVMSGDSFTERYVIYEGVSTLGPVASGVTAINTVVIRPGPTIINATTIGAAPYGAAFNYYYAVVNNSGSYSALNCIVQNTEISTYNAPVGTYLYSYPLVATFSIPRACPNGELKTIPNWMQYSGGRLQISNAVTGTFNPVYIKVYGCMTQL